MSMNLVFQTQQGGHYIDFPYQTSTEVTREVIAATSIKEQLRIIENDLQKIYGSDYEFILDNVAELLGDDSLELTYI